MKVMTVLGTRPEVIKMACVVPELDRHFDQILVHTGQNWDSSLRGVFFEELKIRTPNVFLEAAKGLNTIEAIGCMMACIDSTIRTHSPEAMLILGDTNSCLATAYVAKRRKIPLFHAEAGNRCFDQRTPEEINRKMVDHLSDINMVYTEHARRNLLAEGVHPQTIVKTGSPMPEVLRWYRSAIQASRILDRLEIEPRQYFVLSAHREETVDDTESLTALLLRVAELTKDYEVVFPVHPRTLSRLGCVVIPPGLTFIEPLGFLDYAHLQENARCVFSDSGTLTEEAAILKFPAVMIRQSHERPEGIDSGATILCDPVSGDLRAAAELAITQPAGGVPEDYAPTDVARKVARTILSYADFVNRTVWKK